MSRLSGHDQGTTKEWQLPSECLIGRRSSCDIQLSGSTVSGRHALIRWSDGWLVRDLGSRNGTYHNGRRLEPAQEVLLQRGDRLAFAEQGQEWHLIADSAPLPMLHALGPGPRTTITLDDADGLNLVPSIENPLATVVLQGEEWLVEHMDGTLQAIKNRDDVVIGDQRYRLDLPTKVTQTMVIELGRKRYLADGTYAFEITANHEGALLRANFSGQVVEIGPRTHFYTLAYLARHRMDQFHQGMSDHEAGWMTADELCRALAIASREQLGVAVHRIRKALSGLELVDASTVIDRSRRGSLRIGVPAKALRIQQA